MGKRANGEGNIRRRKDGRWQARVMNGRVQDGRPRMKYFYGPTQKEVKRKLLEFQQELAEGLIMDREYTFTEFSKIWFETHKQQICPATQDGYAFTLRRLNDHFQNRQLKQIKTMEIEKFINDLSDEGKSDSYIQKCRAMLYQIFDKAQANDLVRKNPVRYAQKHRSRYSKKRNDEFNTEEVRLLLKNLPENKIGWSIRLMLGTGIRGQEILGLSRCHISEDGAYLIIEQAVSMNKGVATIGPTKTCASQRCIPVPDNVRHCARLLREGSKNLIWESPKKPGMPCNPSHFRSLFRKAVASVEGVRVLSPHSCRHSYVSQMQMLGVDLATIQSIVGHTNVAMTKEYLHVQEQIRVAAADKFSKEFGSMV